MHIVTYTEFPFPASPGAIKPQIKPYATNVTTYEQKEDRGFIPEISISLLQFHTHITQ